MAVSGIIRGWYSSSSVRFPSTSDSKPSRFWTVRAGEAIQALRYLDADF
jgi:hypothetical protein